MATWTSLTYAFGSKLTSAKMTQNQDNFLALAEGASGAPKIQLAAMDTDSVDTDQIVTDAVDNAEIATDAVHQNEIKTTTASQSISVAASGHTTITLTGGTWGWWFPGGDADEISVQGNDATYAAIVGFKNSNSVDSSTAYLYSRYIQTSPPYKIGDYTWGHFIYLLRKIGTGEIIGTYEAPDPIYAYDDRAAGLGKDSIDRILIKPHPFNNQYDNNGNLILDYINGNLASLGVEIILIDTRDFDIIEFKKSARLNGLDLAKEVMNHHAIENIVAFKDLGINDNIPGLTDKIKIKGLI